MSDDLSFAGDALAPARAEAEARLAAMGLPGRRDEYWRFTRPEALTGAVAPFPAHAEDSPFFDDLDALNLVFVDGRLDVAASDPLDGLDGVAITPLAATPWAAGFYGTLERMGQTPVARPLAALNTARAQDGVALHVTGKAARPIHIIHRRRADDADPVWHHLIRMEAGAELTLIETGLAGARQNGLVEADLGTAARLHLISARPAGEPAVAVSQLFARVAQEAALKSFALSVDGRLMRHEAQVELAGDDALVHLAGAVLGDGAAGPFHHDDTVFITHGALRGESRQVFKKVLKNGATGVFQGKILVRPGAQKTDGYQISQSLLLDGDSQFLAKPELEIYADDVKCSHGSTTGAIDETALFYLRSRGIPEDRAVVLLVLSFLADALEEVEDEGLREALPLRLEDWLTREDR